MAFLNKYGKIEGNYDAYTGVPFLVTPTDTFVDGTAITDDKLDYAIYYPLPSDLALKSGFKYGRRDFENYISTRILGASPSESSFRKFIAALGNDKVEVFLEHIIPITVNLVIPENILIKYGKGCYFRVNIGAGGGTGTFVDVKSQHNVVNIEQFGGVGDGMFYEGIGNIEFNDNVFTVNEPVFKPEHVGMVICIRNAGTLSGSSHRVLSTLISAYDSPTQVRLQTLSTYKVTNESFFFGTDNTNALYRFNLWAREASGKVDLTYLAKNAIYLNKTPRWTCNILDLEVEGNGCRIVNIATNPWDRASLFTAAGVSLTARDGVIPGNAEGYLIKTAERDSLSVEFINPADAAKFVVGEQVVITSHCSTFNGFPPDFRYCDYVGELTSVNPQTGVIGFDIPLKHRHKEDAIWSIEADNYMKVSGRASVLKLERGTKFGIHQVFKNMKFSCETDAIGAARAIGWHIEFYRCIFDTIVTTVFKTVKFTECRQLSKTSNELDKMGDTVIIDGANWNMITTGGGIENIIFSNSTLRRIESLSCRNQTYYNCTKAAEPGFSQWGVGDRNGGCNKIMVIGGEFNELPGYAMQYQQAKKVQIGVAGVTYEDGKLIVPNVSSPHGNFLTYLEEGKRLTMFAQGLSSARALNNHGYITNISSTGTHTTIFVKFKTPPVQPNPNATPAVLGDVIGIFTEPEYVKLQGVTVNGKLVADRDYLQVTYNPKLEAVTLANGYDVRVPTLGGILRRFEVVVRKPYTGASATAKLRIDATFPVNTNVPFMEIDLKKAGVRTVDNYTNTGKTGVDVLPNNFGISPDLFKSEYRVRTLGTLLGNPEDMAVVDVYFFTQDVQDVVPVQLPVKSVAGDLVDNTDPNNPKINFNPSIVSSDAASYQIPGRGTYTFTGESATWVLPNVNTTQGHVVRIISWGTGSLNVTGDINESGEDMASREMMKGETATFTNNGFKWVIT